MAFCKNCGAELPEGAKFCTSCGSATEEKVAETPTENQTVYSEPVTPPPAPKERTLNVGMLVFSIINTALCCQLFGIIAIIMTILAKSADTDEDESRKLRTAKILNILGVVLGFVISVAYIVIMVVAGLMGTASEIATGTL